MFKNRLPELNQDRRKVCKSRRGEGDNSKPRLGRLKELGMY